jgi:hypothetical protein
LEEKVEAYTSVEQDHDCASRYSYGQRVRQEEGSTTAATAAATRAGTYCLIDCQP